jgi:hypothetical protein
MLGSTVYATARSKRKPPRHTQLPQHILCILPGSHERTRLLQLLASCCCYVVLQVAVHSAMQLPDVRVSFLGVMTSLAAGPKGSRFILAQFRQNASKAELEHFTWRKLFATIVAYCRCAGYCWVSLMCLLSRGKERVDPRLLITCVTLLIMSACASKKGSYFFVSTRRS